MWARFVLERYQLHPFLLGSASCAAMSTEWRKLCNCAPYNYTSLKLWTMQLCNCAPYNYRTLKLWNATLHCETRKPLRWKTVKLSDCEMLNNCKTVQILEQCKCQLCNHFSTFFSFLRLSQKIKRALTPSTGKPSKIWENNVIPCVYLAFI